MTLDKLQRCASGHTWRPTGPMEDEYGLVWPAVTACPVCANGNKPNSRSEDYWRLKASEAEALQAQGMGFSRICDRLRVGHTGLRAAMQRFSGDELPPKR